MHGPVNIRYHWNASICASLIKPSLSRLWILLHKTLTSVECKLRCFMHTAQDNIRNICFRIPLEPKALDWTRKQKQISDRVKDVHSLLLWHSNCEIHIKILLSFTTINTDHLSRDPHLSKPWLRPLSYTVFSSDWILNISEYYFYVVSHIILQKCAGLIFILANLSTTVLNSRMDSCYVYSLFAIWRQHPAVLQLLYFLQKS